MSAVTPPKSVPPKPKMPIRARARQMGAAIQKAFARIPWQIWRTLAGIMVIALAIFWISRACTRGRLAQPPVAPPQPLTDACYPAPEPYLD